MSKKNSRVNHQPPNVSLRSFGNCLNPPEWLTKSHVLPALVYTKKWQDIILRSLCSMTFLRSVWIWMFRKVAFQYHHTLEKTTWSCVSQPRNYKLSNVPKKTTSFYHMGVSKNCGTPKSSILISFSIINHPFWATTIFGNFHYPPKASKDHPDQRIDGTAAWSRRFNRWFSCLKRKNRLKIWKSMKIPFVLYENCLCWLVAESWLVWCLRESPILSQHDVSRICCY